MTINKMEKNIIITENQMKVFEELLEKEKDKKNISRILENDLGKQKAIYLDLKKLGKDWGISPEEIIYVLEKYKPKYGRKNINL